MTESQAACNFYRHQTCILGEFGGNPGPEDCASCSKYEGDPRGLGDRVHGVLKRTGVEKVVKKIAGKRDCGCGKRRAAMNKAFPSKDQNDA
tara:strand:+ start:71 stop:343 length:273 start_codon:yes stop_codon:yes gene_type:complete